MPKILRGLMTPVQPLRSRIHWILSFGFVFLFGFRLMSTEFWTVVLNLSTYLSRLKLSERTKQLFLYGRTVDEDGELTLTSLRKKFPHRWYADRIKLMGWANLYTKSGRYSSVLGLDYFLAAVSGTIVVLTVYLWLGLTVSLLTSIGVTFLTLSVILTMSLVYWFFALMFFIMHIWPVQYARQLRADLARVESLLGK